MTSIAILGSGFGLYGYLPALASCGHRIVLPERYRARFDARAELRPFANQVDWSDDELSALQVSSAAVLALCPEMQCQWLTTCLAQPRLERLFLEKPLAPNPRVASVLQARLKRSNKIIRIAYVFRYLDWTNQLRCCLSQDATSSVALCWRFKAHHYRNHIPTWKRDFEQGGGPVRFYGVHVLALLAELGYSSVVRTTAFQHERREVSGWMATFAGANLPNFEVQIDADSESDEFLVTRRTALRTEQLVQRTDPFAEGRVTYAAGSLDGRVRTLQRLCQSAWSDPVLLPDFYGHAIDLWNELEQSEQYSAGRVAA